MGLWARRLVTRLSMYNLVDPDIPSWSLQRSRHSQTNSFEALAATIYSTCVEDVATVVCCFDAQEMAPPAYKKAYPEIEQQLRQSLAQSTSVYPTSSDSPIVYMMPRLGHPARYHIICLTLLMWSGLNVAANGERDLIVAHMSG